jgi:signal transduction histidine kinase
VPCRPTRRWAGALLRDPRAQGIGNALLTSALTVSSVIGVLSGEPSWGNQRPLALTLAVASTLPVGWRGRYPLTIATVVLAANAGCIYAAGVHGDALQPFLALLLTAYSAGSRAEGSRGNYVPILLAIAAVGPFALSVTNGGEEPGNVVPSYLFLLVFWVIGRVARGWRHQNRALAAANRELAEQRELQAQAAVMVERGRIARELHDVVAHNVSMMAVQAGAAHRVLAGDQQAVRKALEVIAETGRQTIDEMRTLLGVLRASGEGGTRSPQPGLADLGQLAASVRAAGVPVEIRVEGTPRPLGQALDLSAFRIVQEALTNAVRHAGPASANVVIRYAGNALELEITDTGTGQGPARTGGHGLIGMRERVAMFGGSLIAEPASAGGFAVRACLPLPAHPMETRAPA